MKSLDAIFKPRSIAVIGATDRKYTLNHAILMNLFEFNFKGPIYPVNPKHRYVHGIRAYPTVEDIPDEVDLAAIMVPKAVVPKVIDQCGRKGVKGVVVITAGYKETGKEGAELERKLVEQVRSYGIRLIGPNCFGVMNTHPDTQLNATFSAYKPVPGSVGFISQSGALGEILIDRAQRESLGMAQFASVGNKADIDGVEILDYWADDDDILAILLYLENIGSPRRFSRLAQKISRKKPIVTLKAGITARGAQAASSHTGALADEEAANRAIFEQYGVIGVSSVEQLFQVGSLLVNQPPSKGKNTCVITNAGGPAILQTDALINSGLNMVDISPANKRKLRKVLRPESSVKNPIDLIASGGSAEYRAALEVAFSQENIHNVIVMFIPVIMIDAMEIAELIAEFSDRNEKMMQVVWLASGKLRGEEAERFLRSKKVPMYEMPLDAARALNLAVSYWDWRRQPVGKEVKHRVKLPKAREIIGCARKNGVTALDDHDAMQLLDIYKLPTLKTFRVQTRDEALESAQKLGYPVVLKASRVGLLHKTDIGGVVLDISGPTELMEAYGRIDKSLKKHHLRDGASFLVQPMIDSEDAGVECVLGLRNLKKYGPMLMFGMGGIYIEIMKAVGFRMVPLTTEDARDLITQSPGWPILKGARGRKPVDVDAIVDSILRLGQLAWENPEIGEIDLNPFMVFPDGSMNVALDQVIVLNPPEEDDKYAIEHAGTAVCKGCGKTHDGPCKPAKKKRVKKKTTKKKTVKKSSRPKKASRRKKK